MKGTMTRSLTTSIFYRLFLASICVAIIPGIVIALVGVSYIQSFNARSQAVQVSTDAVKLAATQLADLQHLNADLISLHAEIFVVKNDPGKQNTSIGAMERDLNGEITQLRTNFEQRLGTYQKNYLTTQSAPMQSVRNLLTGDSHFATITMTQQQAFNRIAQQEWQGYVQAMQQDLQALQSSSSSVDQGLLPSVTDAYTALEDDWKQIVNVTETLGDEVAKVSPTQTNGLLIITIIASLCILLVVGAIGYIVNLTIARPLRQLAFLTRRISMGDTRARAQARGYDEIALVARSVNAMVDSIVQLIQETQGQHESLQGWIDQLAGEVTRIGAGNLRVQARVTNTPLGVLAESFNYMVRELSGLVVRVKTSAYAVHRSTEFVFHIMAQIVKTSDVQLKHMNEAKIELQAMAKSSRQVAGRADMLSTAAQEEQQIIRRGRIAVKKATEAMQHMHKNMQETSGKVKKLDERSRDINEILHVLANIAQQTNFLAHEAVSQAAIVGDNGKGFSAVAADIQRLAERVKGQVRSIEEIVDTVREGVQQTSVAILVAEQKCAVGTLLMQNAGDALETIFASIEDQAKEIASIHQVATRQLQSFSVVEHMVQNISSSAQQVNEQARGATWNVEALARLVEALHNSVEVFELSEENARRASTMH
ncbi:MAG: HAMP domain-containing protein [Ktedonobacteraceae bacterium]|nr:HAMP domain-containing protein [Ktedonobacteraceae bacterium]